MDSMDIGHSLETKDHFVLGVIKIGKANLF
jgi:hypothetical protein